MRLLSLLLRARVLLRAWGACKENNPGRGGERRRELRWSRCMTVDV